MRQNSVFKFFKCCSWFSYKKTRIDERNESCTGDDTSDCKNEEWYRTKISHILQKNYGQYIKGNLTFTFIDAYSQKGRSKADQTQQKHFLLETEKLWQFANNPGEVIFQTIDDVLKENQKLKQSEQNLKRNVEALTKRVSDEELTGEGM